MILYERKGMDELYTFGLESIEEQPNTEKPVQFWNWKDFQFYFDTEYARLIGRPVPILAKESFRKKGVIISSSAKLRGNELFKAMIDWLLANYKKYPQWDLVTIGLVCGKHYWANMIADQATKSMKYQIKWEE
jgi:hypothetical protein